MVDREAGKRAFRDARNSDFSDSAWAPMLVEELAAELNRSHSRYAPEAFLGNGGMGAVYSATDHKTSRRVAIKVLRPDALCDEAYIHRFEREVENHRKLDHPNIVRVFDAGKTNEGSRFFVMELLEGHTLSQALQLGQHIDLGQIALTMAGVCSGAQYIHEQGLVHRDFKASNVFLATDGRILILDFGISRNVASDPTTASRLFGMPGTPGHIAPEVRGGQPATHISDIYALGVLFYQMLTGSIPDGWPKDPSKIRGNPALDDVAKKALSASPHERYASATLFSESIGDAMRQSSEPPRAGSEPQKPSTYIAGIVPLPFDCVAVKILHDQTTAIVGGVSGQIAAVELRSGDVICTADAEDSTQSRLGGGEYKYVADGYFFLELAPSRRCFYTMSHSAELKTWIFDGTLRLLTTVSLLTAHFSTLHSEIVKARRRSGWSTWTCYSRDVPDHVPGGIVEAKLSPDRGSILCLTDWFVIFRCDLAGRLRDEPKVVGDAFSIEPANADASEFWVGRSASGEQGIRRLGFRIPEGAVTRVGSYPDDGIYTLSPSTLLAGGRPVGLPALSQIESSELWLSPGLRPVVLPIGRRVLTSLGVTVQIYDLDTLRLAGELIAGHEDDIRAMDATKDESSLISIASRSLRVWDLGALEPVGGYPSSNAFLRSGLSNWDFSTAEGKVYGASGNRITVLDMNKRTVRTLKGRLEAIGIAGGGDSDVHVLSVETEEAEPPAGLQGWIARRLDVSQTAFYLRHLSIVSEEIVQRARVKFELDPHKETRHRWMPNTTKHSTEGSTAIDIGDGRIAILLAGHLAVYDTASRFVVCGPIDISWPTEAAHQEHGVTSAGFGWSYYSQLAVSPDGMRLFVRGHHLPIKVFNSMNLSPESEIPQSKGPLGLLIPWSDSRYVLYSDSTASSGSVTLADASTTQIVGTVCGLDRDIGSGLHKGVLLPGGALAALGRYDRKVWILDLTTGKLQDEPIGFHSASISSVHLCPNKKEIMSTSRDGSARFWNIEDRLRNAPSAAQVLVRARNRSLT